MSSDSTGSGGGGAPSRSAPGAPGGQRGGREEGRVYYCLVCEWEYAEAQGLPEQGFPPGTEFEALSEDFECPECCAIKHWFRERAA